MYSFDSFSMVIAGLITGLVFGLLLQKGRVTRYQVILGQFLFKDFTVLKVMLTAIVVGAVGVWGMLQVGMLAPDDLHVKSAALVANALGGVIFGVGMAILGYCPGTGVGALGDGSRHAIWGVLGMIVGGGIYAETYPYLDGVLGLARQGEITLADVTGLSPWWFIVALVIVAVVVFALIERWERRGMQSPSQPSTGAGSGQAAPAT